MEANRLDVSIASDQPKITRDRWSNNRREAAFLGGQMAHARRKVYEAREFDTACSSPAIALMNRLYEIERDLAGASVQQRTETRQRDSRAVLEGLRRLLDGPLVSNLLPSSRLAQAISYVKQHWTALNRYIEEGRLPIDNNHVERLMRQVAIGRKN